MSQNASGDQNGCYLLPMYASLFSQSGDAQSCCDWLHSTSSMTILFSPDHLNHVIKNDVLDKKREQE